MQEYSKANIIIQNDWSSGNIQSLRRKGPENVSKPKKSTCRFELNASICLFGSLDKSREDSQEACSVHQLVEYIDWLELEYADAMKRTLRPAHANCALRGPLTASNGFQPMAPSEFVSSPATPSTGEPTASAVS